ncbi:DUF1295 domain-containing protein [Sphingorhabdus sp. Alg239-R122]|uniref:DUF1295 domain-containing protein n=1 Tax=Sphingorhabdus sp. Alg239-R122 TaxID=2305989 RepID=UPI0013DD5304|nr:DUF1295 domain-containing protein [Sphingorhabdus sp. Alg239-R122]
MSFGDILPLLGINFALLMAVIVGLWGLSLALKDVSFIDAFWALGMVMLALFSYLLAARSSGATGPHALALLALTTLWGMRLGLHLLTRWMQEGEDPRYKKIIGHAMEKRGWSFAMASLIMVFLMQAPLLFITSLPAQAGILADDGQALGLIAVIGIILSLVGIAFETIGDWQLKKFRANPDNGGKVLDTGLWRYTRHPNYFGDFCAWWGIWLVACDLSIWLGLVTVIGPLFLSFTLMKWSGGPLLERGMKKTRPKYADYVKRTSAFFPMPPKG